MERRFGTAALVVTAVFFLAIVATAFTLLAVHSHLFRETKSVTRLAADGTTIVQVDESLFLVKPAVFAVAILVVAGLLILIVGALLAMAESVVPKEVPTPDPNGVPVVGMAIAPGVVTAVGAAIGEAFKGIASALKDLKSATAALVTGAGLLVAAGVVAIAITPGSGTTGISDTTSTTSTTTAAATTTTAPATGDGSVPESTPRDSTPPDSTPTITTGTASGDDG